MNSLIEADGLPGLQQRYGLKFRDVVTMQQTLKYQATESGAVAGPGCLYHRRTSRSLRLCCSWKMTGNVFPPYEAAALVRGDRRWIQDSRPWSHPHTADQCAFNAQEIMRKLNLRIQEGGETIEHVAHEALRTLGLLQSPRK